MDYRENLYKQYEGLFNKEEQGEDVGDSTDAGAGRPSGFTESQQALDEEKQSKWNWIGIIYRLCSGDITKTEAVVAKPFTECLVWMSYEKETNK